MNWNQLSQNNFNITFENYLITVNTLISSHAPLKKPNKKQKKFQQKPLITKEIQNAIQNKNRFFKEYIKCGDNNKNIFHQEYKKYRNSLPTLINEVKDFITIIISGTTLVISKTPRKELNQ